MSSPAIDLTRRPAPVLRLASLTSARGVGLENALGLAASAGFERVELHASDLPAGAPARAELGALLAELGLRVAAVDVPGEQLDGDALIELCDRARDLDCHRLSVALGPGLDEPGATRAGRRLDAAGYRLAGRSATLVARAAIGDPCGARALAAVLAELSHGAVGLELDAGAALDLAVAWRPRVHALALDDLGLVDPPAGRWREGSAEARAVRWLRRAPEIELVIRRPPDCSADEGETLARARSRWRREVELADRLSGGAGLAAERLAESMYSRISISRWEVAHVEEGHTGGTDHA